MNKKNFIFLPLAGMLVACNPGANPETYEFVPDVLPDAAAETISGLAQVSTLTGTDDPDDEIANSTFDRTISIVFSTSGSAVVSGDEKGIVSVSGNDVTVDNTKNKETIRYELSGSTSDGFLKIYGSKKQALVLNGVSITNPNGAAINNQCKKRCFVVVNGTNTLSDGASYTDTPDSEDEKAAFFSEGQLIFSGSGTLTVTAKGKAGITSDDYVRFLDAPTVKVQSSAGHGVRGKDAVIVSGGTIEASVSAAMKKGFSSDSLVRIEGGATTIKVTGGTALDEDGEYSGSSGIKADKAFEMLSGSLTITNTGQGGKGISGDMDGWFQGGTVSVTVTGSNYGKSNNNGPGGGNSSSTTDNTVGAKGIKFDGNLWFSGADVLSRSSSHEGIEAKGTIVITGGSVYSASKDDAMNAGSHFLIAGGTVFAQSTGNDGIDANGNCYLTGGTLYAIGSGSPEVAVDANTEKGFKLYVVGGTLFSIGGLESGASLVQACYGISSWKGSTLYALSDSKGATLGCFKTLSSASRLSLVVSGADLKAVKAGVTSSGGTSWWDGTVITGGSASGGSDATLSQYTSGNGFGPGGGPGGFGPGGRW